MINRIKKLSEFEKDIKFEKEIYNKGNVFKIVNMPYFQLSSGIWFSNEDIKIFIDIALKDKEKGLNLSDYDLFINLLIKNDNFYNVIRDIFLNGVLK